MANQTTLYLTDNVSLQIGDTLSVTISFKDGTSVQGTGTVQPDIVLSGGVWLPHIDTISIDEDIPDVYDVDHPLDKAFIEEMIWYAITEGGELTYQFDCGVTYRVNGI